MHIELLHYDSSILNYDPFKYDSVVLLELETQKLTWYLIWFIKISVFKTVV